MYYDKVERKRPLLSGFMIIENTRLLPPLTQQTSSAGLISQMAKRNTGPILYSSSKAGRSHDGYDRRMCSDWYETFFYL